MKTSTTLFSSRHFNIAVIVVAALVGTLNSLDLAYQVGNGAFRNDYFRHFYFTVLPLVDGGGSLSLLFNNHHASPLLHLHQIFTSLVLDRSLRVDAYTGIGLFFIMAIYLAVTAFHEVLHRSGSQLYALLVAILISLIATGLTASGPISWPLIYLQGYFLFLGFFIAVATYLICMQPNNRIRIALYAGIVVLAILLHTSYGTMFFVASVPAIAWSAISQRNHKLVFLILGVAVFTLVWNFFVLPMFGQLEFRDTGKSLDYIADRLVDLPLVIAAFGKAVATGVHGDAFSFTINRDALGFWRMAGFFCLAMTYAGATLWATLAQRKLLIAGVIMMAVLLGAMSALLSRGSDTFAFNLDAPRYILLYRIAAAAFFWSIADALISLFGLVTPKGGKRIQGALLSVVALVSLSLVVTLQVAAFDIIAKRKPQMAVAAGWNELAIYMLGVDSVNTYSLKNWQSGANASWVNNKIIAWLVQKEANVFSPDYRGSDYLANYIKARSIYQSRRENPLPLIMDQKNCLQHNGFTRDQAWNIKLKSPINGSFTLAGHTSGRPPLQYFLRTGVQNVYGMLPSGTPIHLCFPADVTVSAFTHLPVVDASN
jgi:hypothetical protein